MNPDYKPSMHLSMEKAYKQRREGTRSPYCNRVILILKKWSKNKAVWGREFVKGDMVQRDWCPLSLVRKGLSRKYLESGFSITVWIREKEQSARRPHTK